MSIITITDITPVMNCFFRMGINVRASFEQKLINYPERFLAALIGTIIWAYAMINYSVVYFNDVDRLVAALTILTQLCLTVIKMALFLRRGRRFINLINRFEHLAAQADRSERDIYNTETRRIMYIVRPYSIACWTTVTICVAVPIIRLLVKYILYTEVDMTLPLPGIFPYDYTKTCNFILTNILSVLLVYFAVNTIVVVEGLFGWFVLNISANFHILRLKLERLMKAYPVFTDGQFKQRLALVVEYHNQILQLAEEFDDVFAEIVFAEVTFSCLQICFLAFQFAFSTDPSIYPFISMLMGSIIIQLMIYCFGGEKVKNENEHMCDVIYLLVQWFDIMPKTQKMLSMPMMRTQRIIKITGYFFVADRNLLVWIFRTAGSFTALLFAMKKDQ